MVNATLSLLERIIAMKKKPSISYTERLQGSHVAYKITLIMRLNFVNDILKCNNSTISFNPVSNKILR